MNRGHGSFVFYACLTVLMGCGARTSTLEDEYGGDNASGASGGLPSGGSDPGKGGSHPIPTGGAPPVSVAGAPPVAGAGGAFAGASGGFAGFGSIGDAAGAPGGIGQLCSAVDASGNSCGACQCKRCAPAIDGCFSDIGCALIFACAQQTGCTGVSCYSPSTCQPVIEQFGGLGGSSVRSVFSLLSCVVSSQSSCGC